MTLRSLAILALVGSPLVAATAGTSSACPFCTASGQTLSENMSGADAVVLARLLDVRPAAGDTEQGVAAAVGGVELTDARFQIVEVLKGPSYAKVGDSFRVNFLGQPDPDLAFLVSALAIPTLEWTTPLPVTSEAAAYIKRLPSAPPGGVDRLAFFQDYLENADALIAKDAYDEFARAPYAEVHALQDRLRHDQLAAWIKDPDVNANRKRLYITMLGVCGSQADVPLLTELMTMNEGQTNQQLDALVGCYLTLTGAEGLPFIEERFLKNPAASYSSVYAAIMGIRFHGQETTIIPRERLAESLHYVLDNKELADLVITDLARWQDWSIMERLVDMFKSTDEKLRWVRNPVIRYLTAAIDQGGDVGHRAQAYIGELEKLDPETVRQAKTYGALDVLIGAPAPARTTTAVSASATGANSAAGPNQDDPTGGGAASAGPAAVESANVGAPPAPAVGVEPAGSDVQTVETPGQPVAPSRLLILAAAAAAGVVLLAAMWAVLRGGGG